MEITKRCTKCKNEYILDDFYRLSDDPNHSLSWCKYCMSESSVARQKKRAKRRISQGLCRDCDTPRLPYSNHFCEFHYIASVTRNAIGRRSKNIARFLRDKLYSQDHKCPYTGETLVLGVNAQIDHVLPVSRYPDQRNNPDNLEWVSSTANRAKNDRTKDEFIAICHTISSRFPKK